MIKRIVFGTLLVGLIGILVAGAIIRTIDKTENVAEARGQGRGRSASESGTYTTEQVGQGLGGNGRWAEPQSQALGGYGQGGARGGEVERQYPNYDTAPEEWVVYSGTVAQSPADGADLVIKTEKGEEVTVGTGPGYMEAQGFTLQTGDAVQVRGYWEDEELKAAQITRLCDGTTITLRDEIGRPMWAGGGRRASERLAAEDGAGFGGEGREDAPGQGDGTGLAQVDAWLTMEGTVVSVDSAALIVRTSDGQEITIDGRPWRFAQEQGFTALVDDPVTLVGFYEGDEFEVGQITGDTSGLVVPIREEGGRPLWAGRGRRGS